MDMKVFNIASAAFISQNAKVAVKWACKKSWGVWNRPVQVGKKNSILGSNLGQIKGFEFAFGCIAVVGHSQRRRLLCTKCTSKLGNQSMGVRLHCKRRKPNVNPVSESKGCGFLLRLNLLLWRGPPRLAPSFGLER